VSNISFQLPNQDYVDYVANIGYKSPSADFQLHDELWDKNKFIFDFDGVQGSYKLFGSKKVVEKAQTKLLGHIEQNMVIKLINLSCYELTGDFGEATQVWLAYESLGLQETN